MDDQTIEQLIADCRRIAAIVEPSLAIDALRVAKALANKSPRCLSMFSKLVGSEELYTALPEEMIAEIRSHVPEEAEPMSCSFLLRLHRYERDRLYKEAKEAGVSVNEWIRRKCFS